MKEALDLVRRARFAVVSTVGPDGAPSSAVVGVAVTDAGELVFDTLADTRKAANLRRDARVAVTAWDGAVTAQLQGVADEPVGAEGERVRGAYLAAFPDGEERLSWPGITHVRVVVRWVRLSDFGPSPPRIVEG